MRDVYVVKHAIATSLGNSVEATWQRLLQGHSALNVIHHFHANRLTSQKACCIPDLLPAARENRVCALTRRVLDPIMPVPPGTCVIWAGIKGNAEYIEADQNIEMPYLPEHYHQWVAARLSIGAIGFDINAACGGRRPEDCPGRVRLRPYLCGRRCHPLCLYRVFRPEGDHPHRVPSFR
jgi:hypothetical protein